jgi:hypothetical protein
MKSEIERERHRAARNEPVWSRLIKARALGGPVFDRGQG